MTPPPLSKATSLASFANTLRATGAPVDSALRRAKLPVRFDERLDAWIPYVGMRRFVADLTAREGLDDLGARAALRSGEGSLDPRLRAALFSAPTLYNALCVVTRFVKYQSTHLQLWLEAHDNMVRVCHIAPLGPDFPGHDVMETHAMHQIAMAVRRFCGPSWLPARAHYQARPGKPGGHFEQAVPFASAGVPNRVHERYGGLDIPAELIWSANRRPERITSAKSTPIPPASVADALRSCLGAYVQDGRPSVQLAAEIMGSSVRTLQRILASEHTSYSKLVELARLDTALEYLVNDDVPIAEIALRLGYSEQSAFSRAFRFWMGVSPSKYRSRLRVQQATGERIMTLQ